MELQGGPHRLDLNNEDSRFSEVYRGLAEDLASGVAVVAARHRNRDHAVTVTGWLDVSWDPPTMVVSLFDEARICEAVEGAGTWTLSFLRADQERVATWLGSPGNPVDGLLTNVPFRRSERSGAPVIDGALAWFELETEQIHPAATHRLVVGRVVAMGRGGGAGDAHAEGGSGEPLVHWARSFHGIS